MTTDANAKTTRPLRGFRFHVFFEGKKEPVAAVSKISALKLTRTPIVWREGGDPNSPRILAGTTKFEPITLEQGLSLDTDLEDWANRVNDFGSHLGVKDNDFRKELNIEVMDLDGNPVLKYKLHRCWVSEYTAISDLDANANAVNIKILKVENEGWERDIG